MTVQENAGYNPRIAPRRASVSEPRTGREAVFSQPNSENFYVVTSDDLPLHCPLPGTTLWNSHPRVYLAIEETGSAKCSYCGAEYRLADETTA